MMITIEYSDRRERWEITWNRNGKKWFTTRRTLERVFIAVQEIVDIGSPQGDAE